MSISYLTPPTPQEIQRGKELIAWHAAKQYVISSLNCPSTADFYSDRTVIDKGDGLFEAYGKVNAQNLFGATLTKRFKITILNGLDDKWFLIDVSFY